MINRVVLVGRLTRDIELRYTQEKIAVISFTVAIDRPQTNKAVEKQTDFINCTAWRNTAEFAAKYAGKGSLVGVDGRLQVRNYTDKDGNQRTVAEVLCENFQIYEWKKDANFAPAPKAVPSSNSNEETIDIEKEINTDKFDLSDDDLPF